jgi:hypothetical protein
LLEGAWDFEKECKSESAREDVWDGLSPFLFVEALEHRQSWPAFLGVLTASVPGGTADIIKEDDGYDNYYYATAAGGIPACVGQLGVRLVKIGEADPQMECSTGAVLLQDGGGVPPHG